MAFVAPTALSGSATPGKDLITIFDVAILTVTGWSKVSSAIVVGTNTWNVYKSAAANNSQGADFYMALGYVTAGGTSVLMTVFEGWNTGTLLATNFAPNSTQIPTVTTWANPNAAAALPSTGTTMAYIQSSVYSTSGVSYSYTVTPDMFAFAVLNSAGPINDGFYMGLYESFMTSADDPFPLVALRLGSSSSVSASAMSGGPTLITGLATREPKQTASVSTNFGTGTAGVTTASWTQAPSSELYSGKPFPARTVLFGRSNTGYRGLLKNIFIGPSQSNNGDAITFTIASVAHTAYRVGASSLGVYIDGV